MEVDGLIRILTDARRMHVRQEAAEKLGSLGNPKAIEPLITTLQRDRQVPVRTAAARALSNFHDDRATAALIAAIKDSESSVKWAAIEALGQIHEPKALGPLISTLSDGENWMSIDAISKFGLVALEPLVKALESENPTLRRGVIETLVRLGPAATERLMEALGSNTAYVREGAAKALGNLGDRSAIGILIAALQDDDPTVVMAAATALGKLNDPIAVEPAIPPLIARLGEEKEQIRLNAAEVLARIGEACIKPVIEVLKDPDWRARQAAVISLGHLSQLNPKSTQSEVIIDALVEALNDPSFRVGKAAATSLGKFNNLTVPQFERVFDSLFTVLQSQQNVVRQEAANALLKGINSFYNMHRWDEEANASTTLRGSSLADIYQFSPEHMIIIALKHPDDGVRLATVNAIGNYIKSISAASQFFPYRLGNIDLLSNILRKEEPTTLVKTLVELTDDPNKQVREAALLALESIREKLVQEFLDQPQTWLNFFEEKEPRSTLQRRNVLLLLAQDEKAATEAIQAAALEQPIPRYADFTFYDDDGKVPDGHGLCSEQRYQLEVAVRVQPTGIPTKGQVRNPIGEPEQQGDVLIMVAVEVKEERFEIDNPVQTLILPPLGDSKGNARFHISPKRSSLTSNDLAIIQVRLFYEFNLLEAVTIAVEVIPALSETTESQFGLEKPISFTQTQLKHDYMDFDNIYPRSMNIVVSKHGDHFQLKFAFRNDVNNELVFRATPPFIASDLEDALLDIRGILYDIAMSETFSEQLEGKKGEFFEYITRLARKGCDLWTLLFRREQANSMFKIGEWLEKHPVKIDGIIQISIEKEAQNFVFPWAFIYDKPLPEDEHEIPPLEGFWGIRYCIEQQFHNQAKSNDEAVNVNDKLSLGWILYQFRNIDRQQLLMSTLEKQCAGRLLVSSPPIDQDKACYAFLHNCEAHVLYFYTHGYTRYRKADIGVGTENFELFKRHYEQLDENSRQRQFNQMLYESIKQDHFEPDRSWIELTHGKVYLDELYRHEVHLQPGSLVILNMCESAQINPGLSDNFASFFIDRGAKGVIGTECPMTVEFAHPFAETLLKGILAGEQVGSVLLKARRNFMNFRNPLGLAYTLFGSATARFEPPSLSIQPSADTTDPSVVEHPT